MKTLRLRSSQDVGESPVRLRSLPSTQTHIPEKTSIPPL